jgi:hypothetical protein
MELKTGNMCRVPSEVRSDYYRRKAQSVSAKPISSICLGRFFIFLILYTVGRTPWTGDQPAARPLPTDRAVQTQDKCTQTSMSQVGFEPTTTAFEQAKTVHALDRAATVIGSNLFY